MLKAGTFVSKNIDNKLVILIKFTSVVTKKMVCSLEIPLILLEGFFNITQNKVLAI